MQLSTVHTPARASSASPSLQTCVHKGIVRRQNAQWPRKSRASADFLVRLRGQPTKSKIKKMVTVSSGAPTFYHTNIICHNMSPHYSLTHCVTGPRDIQSVMLHCYSLRTAARSLTPPRVSHSALSAGGIRSKSSSPLSSFVTFLHLGRRRG